MTRRLFLGSASAAAVPAAETLRDDYPLVLAHAERGVPHLLELQILDPARPDYGGHSDPALGFADYRGAVGAIHYLLTLYSNPDSRYHRDSQLLERLRLSIRFLARHQNPNGTVDLAITNFDSPPDTGFAVRSLIAGYRVYRQAFGAYGGPLGPDEKLLRDFLTRGCDSMVAGGIHTPNHRWVVAAALAESFLVFPDERYRRRAEQWLREGIDVTPEGEYTERSNGTYNPIVNNSLIVLADSLNRPDLLDPVRRNLDLMLYLTHPSGEVVTDYSTRQDRGTRALNTGYFFAYRSMGIRDSNGVFASAADAIVARDRDSGALGGALASFLLDPRMRRDSVARRPLPEQYDRLVAGSATGRMRRGSRSATVVAAFPSFFSLHHGDAVIESLSLITAFFGKGQFVSPALERSGNGYALSQSLEAFYYDPLRPQDIVPGRWSDAERETKRPRTNAQKQRVDIRIAPTDEGYRLELSVEGPRGLPVLLSFGFRAGVQVEAAPGGSLWTGPRDRFLEGGFAVATAGRHAIRFGPGRRDHTLIEMRGAAPWRGLLQFVHLAWRAPVKETLDIACL